MGLFLWNYYLCFLAVGCGYKFWCCLDFFRELISLCGGIGVVRVVELVYFL